MFYGNDVHCFSNDEFLLLSLILLKKKKATFSFFKKKICIVNLFPMCEYVMFHYTSFQANEPIAWCINIQCLLPFVFKLQFITSIYHAFLFQIIDIYHSSTKKKNDIVQLYFIISLPYPFRKRRKKNIIPKCVHYSLHDIFIVLHTFQ